MAARSAAHWSRAAASTGESSASSIPRRVAVSLFSALARLRTDPGSRRQPPAGCASSSASATQRLSFFAERRVEADRAERVLDQIPAVDRLDLRMQREGKNGVPDLAGVAGGEDDQVLTVSPVRRARRGRRARSRTAPP